MNSWLNQDAVIEKIQNKMNNLRNAAFIAEKGKEVIIQNSKEDIEKYTEFKVRAEDYTRQADFLEEILLDIDLAKQEEIKQFEKNLQENKKRAYCE